MIGVISSSGWWVRFVQSSIDTAPRMTGSAVDGEDIVQDALIKALAALPSVGAIGNPEGWLFRIAHNTALDFLRRRSRGPMMQHDEALDMIAAPDSPDQDHEAATMSLRTFMRLPALQRSAVDPEGCAWPFTGGGCVDYRCERGRREIRAPAGACPFARVCQGIRRRLTANAVRWNARPTDHVCRGVQDRRLRHRPRDAG